MGSCDRPCGPKNSATAPYQRLHVVPQKWLRNKVSRQIQSANSPLSAIASFSLSLSFIFSLSPPPDPLHLLLLPSLLHLFTPALLPSLPLYLHCCMWPAPGVFTFYNPQDSGVIHPLVYFFLGLIPSLFPSFRTRTPIKGTTPGPALAASTISRIGSQKHRE